MRGVADLAAPVGRLPASMRRLMDELVDRVVEIAPHVPARDLATLRAHHPDARAPDDLARKLVDTAARSTGAVGAAGGIASSFEVAAPPLLLSAPVQIVAETCAVVGIELKLVAELHEVYGRPAVGTPAVRAAAYLGAWTRRRALDTLNPASGWSGVLSGAARRQLRQRLVRRAGSNAASIVPFLAGAVAGASLNARETRRLGQQLIHDLSQ